MWIILNVAAIWLGTRSLTAWTCDWKVVKSLVDACDRLKPLTIVLGALAPTFVARREADLDTTTAVDAGCPGADIVRNTLSSAT